jgi:hypothetical protein
MRANPPGRSPASTIMNKSQIPVASRHFIEQATVAEPDGDKVRKSDLKSPYSSYWYRAIACNLLIKPNSDPFHFIHRCRMLGFTVTIL